MNYRLFARKQGSEKPILVMTALNKDNEKSVQPDMITTKHFPIMRSAGGALHARTQTNIKFCKGSLSKVWPAGLCMLFLALFSWPVYSIGILGADRTEEDYKIRLNIPIFGYVLRQEREQQGLSIEQLAQKMIEESRRREQQGLSIEQLAQKMIEESRRNERNERNKSFAKKLREMFQGNSHRVKTEASLITEASLRVKTEASLITEASLRVKTEASLIADYSAFINVVEKGQVYIDKNGYERKITLEQVSLIADALQFPLMENFRSELRKALSEQELSIDQLAQKMKKYSRTWVWRLGSAHTWIERLGRFETKQEREKVHEVAYSNFIYNIKHRRSNVQLIEVSLMAVVLQIPIETLFGFSPCKKAFSVPR